MAEPEARYVVTFRTQTPETVPAVLATLVGALVATFFAWVIYAVECDWEAWSECTSGA